jgi:hypothetical protein
VPGVPYDPEEEPENDRELPDFDEIVEQILDRDDPTPTPSAA